MQSGICLQNIVTYRQSQLTCLIFHAQSTKMKLHNVISMAQEKKQRQKDGYAYL